MTLRYDIVDAIAGPMAVVMMGDALAAIVWTGEGRRWMELLPPRLQPAAMKRPPVRDHEAVRPAREWLTAYFAGERLTFADYAGPLDSGGTDFQRAVWNALKTIPYGQTCSYGDVARMVGSPGAVRAVGAANGANPIPVIVPCHRVIGADGKLTGFTGGLWRKKKLLALEQGGVLFAES